DIRIHATIAGGTNIENVRRFHLRHDILERLAVLPAGPRVAGDANVETLLPQAEYLVKAQDGIGNGSVSVGIEKFAGQKLRTPIYAGHALSVICHRAYRSRDVCTVPIVVLSARGAGAVDAGKTVRTVSGVDPQIALQIRVHVVNTGVENGHDDVGGAGLIIPGLRGGNLRHVPLLWPKRIGRHRRIHSNQVVGFRVLHRPIEAIPGDCRHWIWRAYHSWHCLALETNEDASGMEGLLEIARDPNGFFDVAFSFALSQKTRGAEAN